MGRWPRRINITSSCKNADCVEHERPKGTVEYGVERVRQPPGTFKLRTCFPVSSSLEAAPIVGPSVGSLQRLERVQIILFGLPISRDPLFVNGLRRPAKGLFISFGAQNV